MIVGGIILVVIGLFFAQAAGDDIQMARALGIFWQGASLGTLYFYQAAGVGAIVLGVVAGIFGIRKLI